MDLENLRNRALLSWATVGVLGALCIVFAWLQWVWLGELSRGEKARMQEGLQSSLQRLARDFNAEMSSAIHALRPTEEEIAEAGVDAAYAERMQRWREGGAAPNLFRRVALAVPVHGQVRLRLFQDATGTFATAPWPQEWNIVKAQLEARAKGMPVPPEFAADVLEIPRFGPAQGRVLEQEWLVLEVDSLTLAATSIPALLTRHVGTGMPIAVKVTERFRGGGRELYANGTAQGEAPPDAAVSLFDVNPFGPGFGGRGFRAGGPPPLPQALPPAPAAGAGPRGITKSLVFRAGPPPDAGRGRWRMEVRFADGSLDTLVSRMRWRNVAISGAVLGLLLLVSVLLVRFSRQQRRLAELQLNFVAGVSHELRTPLTVIRTAAYNLRGRVAENPAQVGRYGALIQDEAEKLTALVEQILRFSRAQAGHAVGERRPVSMETVLEEALASRNLGTDNSSITLAKSIEPGLPMVLADETALRQAIQNLLDNAVKYGAPAEPWIGIKARRTGGGERVQVVVEDRGPGIPPDEREEIFHPFFRGRRAEQEQIHGTGLGLSLVKRIADAHQGSITVADGEGSGTAFILEIPAAAAETSDELTHTAG